MNMCLKMLFTLSLSGTALILVLLGATRIFGSHMGRRWQYYIWLAAVFRLLLPIPSPAGLIFPDALKSGMSVGLLSDGGNLHAWMDGRSGSGDRAGQPEPVMGVRPGTGTERLAETGDMEAMAFTAGDTAKADTAKTDTAKTDTAKTDTAKAPGLYLFLLTLWLSVAAVLMGRRIWNYRSTARLCKRNESPAVAGDGGLEAYGAPLEEACRVCGLNRRPRLVVSRVLPSPVTMGLLSPVVIMPADFPADRAYYVFLHELTHIRRMDGVYKWLVEAAVCLHWFNPAVYVLQKEVSRACELSCDEEVIRRMDGRNKHLYGEILLTALRRRPMPVSADMGFPLSENAKWMKERLVSIMEFRKRSRPWSLAACIMSATIVSMAVLCGFAPLQRENGTVGAENVLTGAADRLGAQTIAGIGKTDTSVRSGGSFADSETISWNEYEDVRRSPDQKSLQTKMFWANGYIVALAWNVDPGQYDVVRQVDGKPLCFTGRTEQYADNSAIAEAVRQSIEKQKLSKSKYGFRPEQLALLGAAGPFEGTADELARRFYEADNRSYFAAVSGSVSPETCASLMERFYAENQIEYFAIISKNDDPSLKARKTEMAKQAARAGDADFFSVLKDELTDAEKAEVARNAYQTDHADIFYMTYESLNQEQAGEMALQAYEEDRVEYLYVLKERLSSGQISSLKERAGRDGKQAFLYVLD